MEINVHFINASFVPYAIVELGPAMSEGDVVAAKQQALFTQVVVKLGYFETVESFQDPTHESLEMLDNRHFLVKAQLQTWDTV